MKTFPHACSRRWKVEPNRTLNYVIFPLFFLFFFWFIARFLQRSLNKLNFSWASPVNRLSVALWTLLAASPSTPSLVSCASTVRPTRDQRGRPASLSHSSRGWRSRLPTRLPRGTLAADTRRRIRLPMMSSSCTSIASSRTASCSKRHHRSVHRICEISLVKPRRSNKASLTLWPLDKLRHRLRSCPS